MIVAYIRVSTDKQDVDQQKLAIVDHLSKNGRSADVFKMIEVSSRKNSEDRGIDELIESVGENDTIICTELSRLGRETVESQLIVKKIADKGANMEFVFQPILNITGPMNDPMRKMVLAIYSAMAESERQHISIRTKAGIEKARREGKQIGRPVGKTSFSKLDPKKEEIKDLAERGVNVTNIARIVDVTRQTLYRFLELHSIEIKRVS